MFLVALSILGTALLLAPEPAIAEPAAAIAAPAAPTAPSPVGPLLAIAAGPASIDTYGAPERGARALALTAGVRLTPRLALVGDVWVAQESGGPFESTSQVAAQTFGLQVMPIDRLWLRGGVGVGLSEHSGGLGDPYARDGIAPATLLAAGVDVARGDGWAVDLQARRTAVMPYAAMAVHATAVLAGLTWRR